MSADEAFLFLILYSTVIQAIFVAIYLTRPWYRNHTGRGIMIKALGLLIILIFSALYGVLGPDYWGRDVIRVGGMILVAFGTTYNVYNVYTAPRRAREENAAWLEQSSH